MVDRPPPDTAFLYVMESLEERIGYKFRNSLLLGEALTHPSLAYETQRPHFDNQRLEFLGDAVIQLLLTELLYQLFPAFSEGKLTKLRSRLVSRTALRSYATRIQLGSYLLMGQGEEASGGRERTSTLADAFEALLGAIYLDGGYTAAHTVLLAHCQDAIEAVQSHPEEINPKGELQEILQAIVTASPEYQIISQQGPDHCRLFEASVSWQGLQLGTGQGKSKKEAEAEAASNALQSRRWEALPSNPIPVCEQNGNFPEQPGEPCQ
jgi:ribonuclease III